MADVMATGGYGTRIYFIPNPGVNLNTGQVLKGQGYITINLKGAHYRSAGNLWQKIFGGSDKVSLSTQVTHVSGNTRTSCTSIEEMRQISVGKPYYFGSGRFIALKLPTDCDGVEMGVTISAIENDNLGGALEILNSGELKSTLQLAPPAVSGGIAIANVAKKLLTSTDPQKSLQATYAGRVGVAQSSDPIRDFCLVQGTLILIYRESADDISLDDLDPAQLSTDSDGLKYAGKVVQNTYAMFQISWEQARGEDTLAPWSSMFIEAEGILDQLVTASNDSERQKIWASAFATYQQAAKLLVADPTFTQLDAKGIIASHFLSLRKKFTESVGQPAPAPTRLTIMADLPYPGGNGGTVDVAHLTQIRDDYFARLSRANAPVPGRRPISHDAAFERASITTPSLS